MRIVFFADSLDKQYGGIHVYTRELLHALTTMDTTNEYIILRASAKKQYPNAKEIFVPYTSAPGHRAWRLLYKLPSIAKALRADVVIEPGHFGPFNLPKDIHRVTVIHDLTMFLYPKSHIFFSQFIQRIFFPRILKKATQIITNSNNTTTDLHNFFPSTKHKTNRILLGKNKNYYPRNHTKAVLSKYGINKPYILCTATLEPRKNITTLIHAFDELKSKNDFPHQLILAGKKGWKSEAIAQAIHQSDHKQDIRHLGYVPSSDLPMLYSTSTVFVYPSLYEGFGLPILEAMACGAPVLISNTSSHPEVGGKAAEYFQPESVPALSKQLYNILSDPTKRAAMHQKSLSRANHFSWEITAKKTMEVFEKLHANSYASQAKNQLR